MTWNLSFFSSLDNTVQTYVTLGNNVQVIVFGKGAVGILTKNGDHKYMPDVYHVKGLKHNFMSIRQLIQNCYRVYMDCWAKKEHKEEMVAQGRQNRSMMK